ncbi:hypothetical protein FRAHR75_510055 [Frankia sp. Hr75.2]|nr:hypothetical protein FRAHR75_510055 [Frankia sp. Hr75.2]SQD94365.1 hypothetical protein FMEAI12_2490016 [Parafrankia sp. Ea1.12]
MGDRVCATGVRRGLYALAGLSVPGQGIPPGGVGWLRHNLSGPSEPWTRAFAVVGLLGDAHHPAGNI